MKWLAIRDRDEWGIKVETEEPEEDNADIPKRSRTENAQELAALAARMS
jgi:hypothetical protein